jgi:hypothetical protein
MEFECKDGVCYLKNYDDDYKICPNNKICGNENLNSLSNNKLGLCINCSNLFPSWRNKDSILKIVENYQTCPLCLRKERLCIYRPEKNCPHFLCDDCFKKKYFGIEFEKPLFPLNYETEILYLKNADNNIDEEWMHTSDIIEYIEKLNNWKNFQEKHKIINSKCFQC